MSLKHRVWGGLTRVAPAQNPSLYPVLTTDRAGQPFDLAQYRGKVVLLVNTASQCGFTKQYDALEALFTRHAGAGLVVLGFPSNDFMGQEPGSDAQIQEFCRINHGVTFPLFPKGAVRGRDKQPVFLALTERGPSDLRGEVRWNFEKFLLDREGRLIGRWRSYVSPAGRSFQGAILKALS